MRPSDAHILEWVGQLSLVYFLQLNADFFVIVFEGVVNIRYTAFIEQIDQEIY